MQHTIDLPKKSLIKITESINGNYPCTVFVSVKILQNPQNIIILCIFWILHSRYTNLNKEEYYEKQDFLG